MKKLAIVWMMFGWVALAGTQCSTKANPEPFEHPSSLGGGAGVDESAAGSGEVGGDKRPSGSGGSATKGDAAGANSEGTGGNSDPKDPGGKAGTTETGGVHTAGAGGRAGAAGNGVRPDGGKAGGSAAIGAGGAAGVSTNPGESRGLTVYVIRHAETVANINDGGASTGEGADEFTDLGKRQVIALTEYLTGADITPDAVVVSPTWRTQKTIEPFLIAKSLTGQIWMELDECCAMAPSGGALPTKAKYYSYWKAELVSENFLLRDPKDNLYWQNTTYEAGLFMVMTARDRLLSEFGQSGKTIFVVGHASAGSILSGLLTGYDMVSGPEDPGKNRVYLFNTSVAKLVQDASSGKFKLEGQNINKPPTK